MSRNRTPYATALVANEAGEIFELEGYAAVGMAGETLVPLKAHRLERLPHGSEMMYLPGRMPVLYNMKSREFEVVDEDPFEKGSKLFPVAAFNSPGWVITHNPAFEERVDADPLPLFSYGAVGAVGEFEASCVVQVDTEDRQDLRCMPVEEVEAGVYEIREVLPANRLLLHIKNCALIYGCPAAKNFFLGRYEAPLPSSRNCNARCLGCISFQEEDTGISCCQNRIRFTPSAEEIAELALFHFSRVEDGVVSFGQGCEGDPLLAARVIEPAIEIMREKTDLGTINMNTNASLPDVLDRLFAAGLDSIRVSLNSARKCIYDAYYRPNGYAFEDVLESMEVARRHGKHVAINYLNCPGVTDTMEEKDALFAMLARYEIRQIQWRNLNYDPIRYRALMKEAGPLGPSIGMDALIRETAKRFPGVRHGYFNPPKEAFWPRRTF